MSFQVQVEQLDTVRRRLTVEVPAVEVEGEVANALNELVRTARVPGFRPGRVPRGVVQKRFGERVQADVCERLLRESLFQALQQEQIHPVGPPEVVTEAGGVGEALRYSVTVEVKPDVVARDYRGLEVERPLETVDATSVEAFLERLRQGQAQLQPIEDRVRAERGDVVTVDIEGSTDGRTLKRNEGRQIELGAPGVLPEIDAGLQGAQVGDAVDVVIQFPEDHQDTEMAGRRTELRLQVRGLARKVVPELDDEFAKDVGDCGDLGELRDLVRRRLEAEAAQRADSAARTALQAELLRRHQDVEVPTAMVERRLDAMVEEVRREWQQRRMWPANDTELVQRLRTEFSSDALDHVRTGLLLEAIARQESISIADDELDALVERFVGEETEAAERARAYYQQPEVRAALRSRLVQDKVLGFVLGQAKVTTVEKENDVADIEKSV